MIKRIVGLLAAAAILAVIVFTILGAGSYTSYFERRDAAPTDTPSVASPVAPDAPQNDCGTAGATTENAADSVAAGTPPRQKPADE